MREGTEKPATLFCIPITRIALAANILWKQTDGTTVECFFVAFMAVKVPVIVYDSCNLLTICFVYQLDNWMGDVKVRVCISVFSFLQKHQQK